MPDFRDLPSSAGTYMLYLCLAHSQALTIGHLGRCHLPAGHYFYVGSARGAGGLRSRVGRHLRGDGVAYWHIDYLHAVAEVRNVFYTVTDTSLECAWSLAVAQLPHAFIPVPHFGASDCRSGCGAHLIGAPQHTDLDRVPRALAQITTPSIVSLRLC
jgi:Uri superfamily endonuclease